MKWNKEKNWKVTKEIKHEERKRGRPKNLTLNKAREKKKEGDGDGRWKNEKMEKYDLAVKEKQGKVKYGKKGKGRRARMEKIERDEMEKRRIYEKINENKE